MKIYLLVDRFDFCLEPIFDILCLIWTLIFGNHVYSSMADLSNCDLVQYKLLFITFKGIRIHFCGKGEKDLNCINRMVNKKKRKKKKRYAINCQMRKFSSQLLENIVSYKGAMHI